MTVVLGEMEVARVNAYRSGQGAPPGAYGLVHTQTSSGGYPIRGGGAHQASHLPGGRRPPSPDYVGRWGTRDDPWRGQNEDRLNT